jgi:ferredoxin
VATAGLITVSDPARSVRAADEREGIEMVIDCDGCVMRDIACGDCVVTFLLGPADGLGSAEQAALAVLADGGLVPPLRMRPEVREAPSLPGRVGGGGSPGRRVRGAASA